jgi:hypothetical protein
MMRRHSRGRKTGARISEKAEAFPHCWRQSRFSLPESIERHSRDHLPAAPDAFLPRQTAR